MYSATARPIDPLLPPLLDIFPTLCGVPAVPPTAVGPADAMVAPALFELLIDPRITSVAFAVAFDADVAVVDAPGVDVAVVPSTADAVATPEYSMTVTALTTLPPEATVMLPTALPIFRA